MRISSVAALCLCSTVAVAAGPEGVDLTTTDRTIVREPVYQGQPHYALFVFGMKAEHRSWFVIDGDSVAYIDRNGNGDLTDPEDRVELDVEATKKIRLGGTGAYLAMHEFPLGDVFGTRLHFRLWVRNPAYDVSQDKLHRDHFREYDEKKWVNGSLMRVAKDKTESQNPLLLTIRPAEAQISHFDGPLTFALAFGEMQELQPWPKRSIFEVNIGCRNLPAKDCHSHSFLLTRLTTTETPADVHPIATLTYQELSKDGKPTVQTIKLNERCCGDRFYAPLRLPQSVHGDSVMATVTYSTGASLQIQPAEFRIPIHRGVDRHHEAIYVMFHNPDLTLKQAVNALRKRGLDVHIEANHLRILKEEFPPIVIELVRTSEAQETATAIGLNTEFAESLARCDARFEVGLFDNEKWLEEKQTLIVIQEALQTMTQGFVYSTWNKQLLSPR